MIEFKIPYPPDKTAWNKSFSLNAIYSGKHWSKRKGDKDYWYVITRNALSAGKVPRKMFDKPVRITFSWNDGLDIDNHAYMGKMITDGMKGWVIRQDSPKWFVEVTHKFHDKDWVLVGIEEVSDH
ncbi:MAG: hypothetical protein ACOX05_04105 [Bacillota bacterium]|jgi:hypothetical protein